MSYLSLNANYQQQLFVMKGMVRAWAPYVLVADAALEIKQSRNR